MTTLPGVEPGKARPPLDPRALIEHLVPPWRECIVVDETGSTNADLLARSSAGDDIDGAVLLAEHQRAGRGRHGRSWSAPPRSQLTLSVGIGAAGVPTAAWGWLPLLTGVAVVDTVLEVCGVAAGLKWPNDVIVDGSKLAGILAEVAARQPVVVAGIGLNVSMTPDEAPDPAATSLLMLGSPDVDRTQLADRLLGHLGARIGAWRSAGGPETGLIADYRRLSLTLGSRVRAVLPGEREIVGRARSIDATGRLLIETDHAEVAVSAADITHLRAE